MTKHGLRWGAGVGVVLAAITSALINELDGGWPWWVAAVVAVLASAGLTMWVTSGGGGSNPSTEVREGGVWAGRDVTGKVSTHVQGSGVVQSVAGGSIQRIGPGAVAAGRDITDEVSTDVRLTSCTESAPTGPDPASPVP